MSGVVFFGTPASNDVLHPPQVVLQYLMQGSTLAIKVLMRKIQKPENTV